MDAVGSEYVFQHPPLHIIPDAGHEQHITAQTAGSHGLVGPFAAIGLHETAATDGLPRPGKGFDIGSHIDIGTACHYDLAHFIQQFLGSFSVDGNPSFKYNKKE
jgi:hypothetical protein